MFLIETPVWVIFVPFVLTFASAFFSAFYYRNTYDFKKSCRMYFPAGIVISLIFTFFGLPIVLGIFMVIFGFIVLMFISNRFFNKD